MLKIFKYKYLRSSSMKVLADYAGYVFVRIDQNITDITPEMLDWKPVMETNTIRWILVHITRIASLLIPQVLKKTYNPMDWDDDYEKQEHSFEELKSDLAKARVEVTKLLSEIDEAQLEEEIQIWGEMHPMKIPLFVLLSELVHHNGQIAMLKGVYKRNNQ